MGMRKYEIDAVVGEIVSNIKVARAKKGKSNKVLLAKAHTKYPALKKYLKALEKAEKARIELDTLVDGLNEKKDLGYDCYHMPSTVTEMESYQIKQQREIEFPELDERLIERKVIINGGVELSDLVDKLTKEFS